MASSVYLTLHEQHRPSMLSLYSLSLARMQGAVKRPESPLLLTSRHRCWERLTTGAKRADIMLCKVSWGFGLCLHICPCSGLLLWQIAGRAALRALSCSCPHVSFRSQFRFHHWAGGCACTAPAHRMLRWSAFTCGHPDTPAPAAYALPQQPMSASSWWCLLFPFCQPTHKWRSLAGSSAAAGGSQPYVGWPLGSPQPSACAGLPSRLPSPAFHMLLAMARLSCTARKFRHAAHTQLLLRRRLSCSCWWQPASCCWWWARPATCPLHRPEAPTPSTRLASMSPTHPGTSLSRSHMASASSRTLAPVSSAHLCYTSSMSHCL